MIQEKMLDEIAALPLQAQQEVVDFIAFLRQKYGRIPPVTKAKTDVAAEEFIGMWKDREDLADSSRWVRNVRAKEWSRADG